MEEIVTKKRNEQMKRSLVYSFFKPVAQNDNTTKWMCAASLCKITFKVNFFLFICL